MRVKGLDHVGLTVADLDASVRFYRDGLGLTLLRTGERGDARVRFAVIRAGEQELNIFERAGAGPADKDGATGMDHFCLSVEAPSIDDVIAHLRGAGLTIAKGPEQRRSATSIFVHDPDGVRVELQLPRP
jgi:catechol 2,3-dioxygenase-like lactoylglutathione lyase family enzyme